VNLHYCPTVSPAIVAHTRRHHTKTTGMEHRPFLHVEFVTHADVEVTRNHRDSFILRMIVSGDFVVAARWLALVDLNAPRKAVFLNVVLNVLPQPGVPRAGFLFFLFRSALMVAWRRAFASAIVVTRTGSSLPGRVLSNLCRCSSTVASEPLHVDG
jgi:hypothetical protein